MVRLIANARIHIGRMAVLVDSMASVDVTEHMKARPDGSDADQQLLTAKVGWGVLFERPATLGFRHGRIQDPKGRAMGDQDVRVEGNLIPLLSKQGAPRQVEGPEHECRLPGRTPDPEAIDYTTRVLEVGDAWMVVQQGHCEVWFALKQPIVIAGDQDLVGMGKCFHPGEPGRDFTNIAATCSIPGVDEQVPVGHLDLPVLIVGVADADDFHSRRFSISMDHPTMLMAAVVSVITF